MQREEMRRESVDFGGVPLEKVAASANLPVDISENDRHHDGHRVQEILHATCPRLTSQLLPTHFFL